MRNEPENRVADARVTDVYRALGDKRAPDHLNKKILKMAADATTPYARARTWMRPAAWAATIGLSFAFVLELAQLPSTETVREGPAPTMYSDDFARQNAPDGDVATKARALLPESLSPASLEQADQPLEAERKRAASPPPARLDRRSKEEFVPRDITVLQNAEELARAQAGSDQEPAARAEARDDSTEVPSSATMSAELAAARRQEADRRAAEQVSAKAQGAAASFAAISDVRLAEPACPASARETPQAWLDCIRELRERGQADQADGEYEEFRAVFPEFDDSDTYK